MISYVDPIPAVRKMLDLLMDEKVYGNSFPSNVPLPAVLIRAVGGVGYTRLQLLVRANDDIAAMKTLIRAMNLLEQHAASIAGLRGVWINREANPIGSVDEDTGKPEAWTFLRMEHLEA